jgi:uncharacterized membrane protein (UPF0127 family)
VDAASIARRATCSLGSAVKGSTPLRLSDPPTRSSTSIPASLTAGEAVARKERRWGTARVPRRVSRAIADSRSAEAALSSRASSSWMRFRSDGRIGTVKPSRHHILAVAFVGLLAPSGVAAPAVVPLTLPSGKVLKVEVMVKDEDRAMGLMFRPALPADQGMLFVFERSDFHGIWMKNCKFPIDILWIDDQKAIVHLEESAPACKADPCPVYQTLRRASYVLELNAGQARREKAVVGARVDFRIPR